MDQSDRLQAYIRENAQLHAKAISVPPLRCIYEEPT
jgi:hypothetical protein